jgi:hypothetical protein
MNTVREAQVRADEAPTVPPFFVVGSGRSGTTLLRMMLCSHSRISIPPETWYLLDLLKRFSIDRPLTAAEIESAASMITTHRRWPYMKLDAQEYRRELGQLTEPYLRHVVEIPYRWHMRAEGKVRWGDKTPVYTEIVPELARMFANSLFIHLVRDGRDVAKSLQTAGWIGRWLHNNARQWTREIERERRWPASELQERILQVRYEDLVLDTEGALRKICQFIGEEYEPQMLSWQDKVEEQVPEPELNRIHKKLKLRIGPEAVARWKREMTPRETFVCEAFMGAHLRRLGYECRYRSPLWAPAFVLTRLYCRVVLNGSAKLLKVVMQAVRSPRKRLRHSLGAG